MENPVVEEKAVSGGGATSELEEVGSGEADSKDSTRSLQQAIEESKSFEPSDEIGSEETKNTEPYKWIDGGDYDKKVVTEAPKYQYLWSSCVMS